MGPVVLPSHKRKTLISPYFCFSLLLVLYFLLSLFAIEAVNIFQDGSEIFMNDVEFYLSNIFAICYGIFMIVYTKRLFSLRINFVALILIALLFASNTYAIFSLPEVTPVYEDITYVISNGERVRYAFSFVNVALSLYIMFAIAPVCKLTEKGNNHIISFLSLVCLSSIIASYFLDKEIYAKIFSEESLPTWMGLKSFTNNKNTFGALVLFGILAEIYLFAFDKKWWRLPLMLYYFGSVFLTLSKTSIVCAIFAFLASISYGFIRLFVKKRRWWVLVLFFAYIGINAYIFYLFFHNETVSGTFIGNVLSAISDAIKKPDESTMGSRKIIWEKLWRLLSSDKHYLLFGFGDASFPFLFAFASDTNWKYTFYAHNGILETLGRGGLIRVTIYIFLLVYTLLLCFRFFMSKKSKGGALYLIFFITFLLHSAVESEFLLGNDWKSFAWSFLTILPLLSLRYDETHPKKNEELIEDYCSAQEKYVYASLSSKLSTFILSLALAMIPVALMMSLNGYVSMEIGSCIMGGCFLLSIAFFIVRFRLFDSDASKVALLIGVMLFLALSITASFVISAYFDYAVLPYTVTCFAVSMWFIIISYLFLVATLSSYRLCKLSYMAERCFRQRMARFLLSGK